MKDLDRSSRYWELLDFLDAQGIGNKSGIPLIGGFEDILDGQEIGSGTIYNTVASSLQMIAAISLLSSVELSNKEYSFYEFIKNARSEGILAGSKILDLGCGQLPSFALASSVLGAEVYTADVAPIPSQYLDQVAGHIQVDFMLDESVEVIREYTDDGIDMVTAGMVFEVPLPIVDPINQPDNNRLIEMAEELLADNAVAMIGYELYQKS